MLDQKSIFAFLISRGIMDAERIVIYISVRFAL